MIVDRRHTPQTMGDIARALARTFDPPPALLVAHLAAESNRGRSVYNYNVGNLSGEDGRGYDVAPAPWSTPELIASAPESQRARYEALYQRMLKGQVPEYFRAYDTLVDGVGAYAALVSSARYKPLLDAASEANPKRFAAAVVSTGYCADPECGNWKTYDSLAKEFARDGLVTYAPKRRRTGLWLAALALAAAWAAGGRRAA